MEAPQTLTRSRHGLSLFLVTFGVLFSFSFLGGQGDAADSGEVTPLFSMIFV